MRNILVLALLFLTACAKPQPLTQPEIPLVPQRNTSFGIGEMKCSKKVMYRVRLSPITNRQEFMGTAIDGQYNPELRLMRITKLEAEFITYNLGARHYITGMNITLDNFKREKNYWRAVSTNTPVKSDSPNLIYDFVGAKLQIPVNPTFLSLIVTDPRFNPSDWATVFVRIYGTQPSKTCGDSVVEFWSREEPDGVKKQP
jgi:hypothetical protein